MVMTICDLGDDKFQVQSSTKPSHFYVVDLSMQSCDCPDWPRDTCACMSPLLHIFLGMEICNRREGPQRSHPNLGRLGRSHVGYWDSHLSLGECNHHLQGTPEPWWTIVPWDCLKSPDGWVTSDWHCSLLSSLRKPPPRQGIHPTFQLNEGTWTRTTKWMGAKWQQKKPHPTTTLPPEPSATHCIWELNHKKAHMKITDPYSSGVSSSWDAAPDARTAAQNAEACAATENGVALPPQPQKHGCKHVGTSALSTTPSSSAPLPQSHLPPLHGTPIPQFTILECTHIPHIFTILIPIYLLPNLRVDCPPFLVLYFAN